jgi:hypothetical protein
MEIKANGTVLFSNLPVIPLNVLTDLEGNTFGSSDKAFFDGIQKEGYFNKKMLSISLQNNGGAETWQIVSPMDKLLNSCWKMAAG